MPRKRSVHAVPLLPQPVATTISMNLTKPCGRQRTASAGARAMGRRRLAPTALPVAPGVSSGRAGASWAGCGAPLPAAGRGAPPELACSPAPARAPCAPLPVCSRLCELLSSLARAAGSLAAASTPLGRSAVSALVLSPAAASAAARRALPLAFAQPCSAGRPLVLAPAPLLARASLAACSTPAARKQTRCPACTACASSLSRRSPHRLRIHKSWLGERLVLAAHLPLLVWQAAPGPAWHTPPQQGPGLRPHRRAHAQRRANCFAGSSKTRLSADSLSLQLTAAWSIYKKDDILSHVCFFTH